MKKYVFTGLLVAVSSIVISGVIGVVMGANSYNLNVDTHTNAKFNMFDECLSFMMVQPRGDTSDAEAKIVSKRLNETLAKNGFAIVDKNNTQGNIFAKQVALGLIDGKSATAQKTVDALNAELAENHYVIVKK